MNNKERLVLSFQSYNEANDYYESLHDLGYSKDDVSILMTDQTRDSIPEYLSIKESESVMKDVWTGAATWWTIWWIIWAIVALGTSVIFPVSGVVIAWPLLWVLTWAGAWWIVGWLVWALTNIWLNNDEAEKFSEKIQNWEIVLVIEVKDEHHKHRLMDLKNTYTHSYYANTAH